MNSSSRYAIYFVPAADQPLFRFGRAVLGYDCYTGETVAHPLFDAITPPEWAALTREPSIYGFHATLKAPFRLPPSTGEAELMQAFAGFTASGLAAAIINPCIRTLGRYVVLMARRPCPALDALAARCVSAFDRFRAPLTQAERERRLSAGLSPAEIAYLDQWGYPFVFDAYRFHMTLAGPVAPERRDAALASMQEAFARLCGDTELIVDRVALLRQYNAQSRFRVLAQAPLGG